MKRNGNDRALERRVALLETAYLEDRERWRRKDETVMAMLHAIKAQGEELKDHREELKALGLRIDLHIRQSQERWQKNEQRWQKNEQKNEERWRKCDERLELAMQNLHRLMER